MIYLIAHLLCARGTEKAGYGPVLSCSLSLSPPSPGIYALILTATKPVGVTGREAGGAHPGPWTIRCCGRCGCSQPVEPLAATMLISLWPALFPDKAGQGPDTDSHRKTHPSRCSRRPALRVAFRTQSGTASQSKSPSPEGWAWGRAQATHWHRPCGHLYGQPTCLPPSLPFRSHFCLFHFLSALSCPLECVLFSSVAMSPSFRGITTS